MNVIVFGASKGGQKFYNYVLKKREDINILAFADDNQEIVGQSLNGIPIISPKEIPDLCFDKIYIAIGVQVYIAEVLKQLKDMGVARDKVDFAAPLVNGYDENANLRDIWLKDYAHHVYMNKIPGNTAECGVYKGHFAHFINKYFHDRKLYLFDTFDGFPESDMDIELGMGNNSFNNSIFATRKNMFKAVDVDVVMANMLYQENCIIKKGYFPDTAQNLQDQFCFVSLDMDLYKPMLDGLRFFWGKMACGGVILLHDYYHEDLPGVALAVSDFEKDAGERIAKTTIGDFCSIALIKN